MWQELSDGYVEKYVWHWFVFTIKHEKKLSKWRQDFPNKKIFVNFVCFENKIKGFSFGHSQIISIVKETILYIAFIGTISVFMDVMPGNARESKKNHVCWKKYCLSYYSKSTI